MKSLDELTQLIQRRGVHAVFGAPGEGWAIEQNPDEFAVFAAAMQTMNVRSVLEIGTGYRAGLSRFMSIDMGWEVVTVDSVNYGHVIPGIIFLTLDDLRGIDPASVMKPVDLVFIDGDHHYEAVKADHERYAAFARKAVAFHDTEGLRDCAGVRDYWREIAYTKAGKLRKNYVEAVAADERRAGIGWYLV